MDTDLLKALMDAAKNDSEKGSSPAPYSLPVAFDLLTTPHEFKPGDLVEWKPGMKNCGVPKVGDPMVIVDVDLSDRDETSKAGSQHYHEPLDITGMLWVQDEWCIYHYDSRRFQPYIAPAEAD